MINNREPPASALARGPAKATDIQRVRRELGAAERCAARRLQAAASRHRRHAARRRGPVRSTDPDGDERLTI
jgi:hypothetical protein